MNIITGVKIHFQQLFIFQKNDQLRVIDDEDPKPSLIKKVKKQLTKLKSSPSHPKGPKAEDKKPGDDDSKDPKTEDQADEKGLHES